MIINIWSTPRTGSVWLMYHLNNQYKIPNTKHIAAPFEQWQNETYRIVLPNGRDKFIPNYREGAFWEEFYLDEHGVLKSRLNYSNRIRNPEQEAEYNFDLFTKIKGDQLVIVNSHVPVSKKYFDPMINLACRNIWIYRKNKRDQLASWVISMTSGTFTYFDKSHVYSDFVETCDRKILLDLMTRIKYWDMCNKDGHEVLSFEDLEFYSGPGFPVDGNVNSWSRLGKQIQNDITDLVNKYHDEPHLQ